MNTKIWTTLTLITLILTACSAASTTPQIGPDTTNRVLSPATQLILGTFKLDDTAQAVTAEQAKQLLPLWQVYQDLLTSDTAAQEEIDALVEQIQGTMTTEQTQAITAMNLTQQDVFALMQAQGMGMAQQNNASNNSTTTSQGGSGFSGPPDGFAGGPPDGVVPGGFTQRNQSQNSTQSDTTTTPTRIDPATLMLDPLIELLKQKAGL